jgi:hypothetical protein
MPVALWAVQTPTTRVIQRGRVPASVGLSAEAAACVLDMADNPSARC